MTETIFAYQKGLEPLPWRLELQMLAINTTDIFAERVRVERTSYRLQRYAIEPSLLSFLIFGCYMGFEPIPWFSQNQMLTATTTTPYKNKKSELISRFGLYVLTLFKLYLT